jgi:putative DNA primase/helicase
MTDKDWISPDEKRRRQRVERERQRAEREAKEKAEREGNGHNPAPPPKTPEPPDEAATFVEIERLAKLGVIAYQRTREAAAKFLGLKLGVLDRLVQAKRDDRPNGGGAPPDIEPWPDPVDDAEALLDEIAAAIERHVVLSAHAADAVALWIVMSHAFDAFNILPRLGVSSATKRCGKTTLMKIIWSMVPRPLPSSNTTAAAVFRAIDKWRPTFLIDEADGFLPGNDDLRSILDSGHERVFAHTTRCIGENSDPRQFSTWCPMVIAGIGKLPSTLQDRSIVIVLKRRLRGEPIERFDVSKNPYRKHAERAARWAADHMQALTQADPVLSDAVFNRAGDNWRPLFAIADAVGGRWPERAREVALALGDEDDDRLTMLLADIRDAFGGRLAIASTELAEALGKMEGRPWPEYGKSRKPITTNTVARLLRPLGIKPRHGRAGNDYLASDFAEAFERYLGPPPV